MLNIFLLNMSQMQIAEEIYQLGETRPAASSGSAVYLLLLNPLATFGEIMEKLPLKDLDLNGIDGNATEKLFGSEQWTELSRACLGCGTCTYVCPTCQCYDIRDFDTGREIRRYRCWDSCMYSDFTRMAHGNPRKSQVERFRQRFMHKLVYFPANNDGMYSCVGCGRCVAKCPISMNIVKVVKALGPEARNKV